LLSDDLKNKLYYDCFQKVLYHYSHQMRNPHECLKIKRSCGFLFVLECADTNECQRF